MAEVGHCPERRASLPRNARKWVTGRSRSAWLVLALSFALAGSWAHAQGFGGGAISNPVGHCISAEERGAAEARVLEFHRQHGDPARSSLAGAGPAAYAFYPQAGDLSKDLFRNNFIDLNSAPGAVLDWDCTDYTYDGHRGIDSDIRTFGEQALGVPIFAALDGLVVDAHDGEPDENTTAPAVPANYVILYHGSSHYTYYWHMKNGSVAVAVNDAVKAGEQIGLTASSGTSTGPHLHFESVFQGSAYEPYTGPCNPGPSFWTNQVPIRRDFYLNDFNISNAIFESYPGLPHDMPRRGAYVAGFQRIGFWIRAYNLPANSTWRVRYLNPSQVPVIDSAGVFQAGGNPFYRWSWWYWWYTANFITLGTWHIELTINGEVVVLAPFRVVPTPGLAVNQPPHGVVPIFDPPEPTADQVVFCKLEADFILDDPDYEIVRYRYLWSVDGTAVRDVTTAALSDAITHSLAKPGQLLRCEVTPMDGQSAGPTNAVTTIFGSENRVPPVWRLYR